MTLFEIAKNSGNVSEAAELLRQGMNVNEQDKNGWTPLNWAAGRGNLDLVQLLLDNGADVLRTGSDQRTASKIALAAGHADVAMVLQKAEAIAGAPAPPTRQYCKAYYLEDLHKFANWVELASGSTAALGNLGSSNDASVHGTQPEVAFIHEDYTVTRSIWHGEEVLLDCVTESWKEYCEGVLGFRVPSDQDLVVTGKAAVPTSA